MNRIFNYLKKYKLLLIVPALAMVASVILDMYNPYFSRIMIDNVLTDGDYSLFGKVIFGILFITLSRAVLGYIREYMFDKTSVMVHQDIKMDLFKHIESLDFKYFDGMNTGELMSRIGSDIDNIWDSIEFGLSLLVENCIQFVIASVIMFCLNWKLAIFTLITMPIIGYISLKLEKSMGGVFDKISDQAALMNTTAQENIAGVRLVKAFSREKYEIKRFFNMNRMNYDLNVEKSKVWSKYFPIIVFLGDISVVFIVSFGGIFVINEQMSIGTLFAYTQYVWMLIWPVRMLGWLSNVLSESKASAKKIDKIFNIKPGIKETEKPEKINLSGHIIFNNVSFKYNDEYVLKNIKLNVKPGSTLAIMGETGSGKTTLVNLIARFYEVNEGEIIIDGHNIKDILKKDLRKNISYVFQDNFLFSDSVFNNVRYGDSDATKEKFEDVLKYSCAEEFVYKLKNKENTIIGERGIGLSGGQKQRLCIARAMLKKAKIIVFDDATSALDMETEYNLLKNIKKINKNATKIIIAHRISAVKNADQILYMKDGKIVEKGTHSELIKNHSNYYSIYKQQFKDFEEVKNMQEVI